MTPVWKTLSPSLVTSRSSCSVFNLCCCTVAIFNRHEFDPISTAANVGIFLHHLFGGKYPVSSRLHPAAPESLHPFLRRAIYHLAIYSGRAPRTHDESHPR